MEAAAIDILPIHPDVEARAPARTLSPTGLLLCATAVGLALQVNFGQYHPLAVFWLTVALAVGAVSILAPSALPPLERKAPWVLGIALGLQFVLLLTRSPGATGGLAGDGTHLGPFRVGIAAQVVFTTAALYLKGRAGRACLFAMLFTHAAFGIWVLHAAPDPGVDVITFQRGSADALLDGRDPYSLTFPNPYADPTPFYGPDAVRDDRLLFGFPYPPLSLLLILPAHLFGDFRYAHLAAMTLAGAFVALARPGRLATFAAAILLFTPRGFFVLEAGWTEPLAVLLLAATVFVACRRPRSLPLSLGLLVAVKQYLVLALLLTPLLKGSVRQSTRRLFWTTLAVATAVTLPLALRDLAAFVHSTVLLQFRQPFRPDALSYPAALFHATGWRAPSWLAFAAIVPAGVLCLRKCPRTPAGFAAGLGLVLFVFFALNKQAFCNYYHLVVAALCCAAGTAERPPD